MGHLLYFYIRNRCEKIVTVTDCFLLAHPVHDRALPGRLSFLTDSNFIVASEWYFIKFIN